MVASPCVSICVLNDDNVCTGCYRHMNEITGWSYLTDDEKRQVLEKVAAREKASGRLLPLS